MTKIRQPIGKEPTHIGPRKRNEQEKLQMRIAKKDRIIQNTKEEEEEEKVEQEEAAELLKEGYEKNYALCLCV